MGDGEVLQLRIHGVNNTPPVSLLYAIEQERGDDLVGVYQQRANGALVKAYSWGGLARTSPIRRIPFAGWVQSIGNAAWIFVMPFGLTNVAYWSRRLTMPGKSFGAATRVTAGMTRTFALGLTLLLVSSVCAVSLGVVETRLASEQPPRWLAWLGQADAGDRTALLATLPVLVMGLLWFLGRVTRAHDNGSSIDTPVAVATEVGAAERQAWKFGCRSFWDNADLSKHNAIIHLAAGVALTLVWTGQFWLPQYRVAGIAVIVVAWVIIAGCVGLMFWMPLVTEHEEVGALRKALPIGLAGASATIFGAQFVALICLGDFTVAAGPRFTGMSFLPGALVFVLVVIAMSALGWRHYQRASYLVAAVPISVGAILLLAHQFTVFSPSCLVILDVLLVLLLVGAALFWVSQVCRVRSSAQVAEAWRGTAPGVLLLLALFASVLLSTVFVAVSATLIGDGDFSASPAEQQTVPPIYLMFASMITLVVILLAIALLAVLLPGLRRTNPVEPELDLTTQPSAGEMELISREFGVTWQSKRVTARRMAALAHRAEPMAAVLAVVVGVALCLGLILALMLHNGTIDDAKLPVLPWTRDAGVFLAVALGGLIVGLGSGSGRPLGIVWDLICFLPRAAHPFGPPCYAQTAVPDLLAYCRLWLDGSPDEAAPRKLVLSAHSLGGVLAVAVVLLLGEKYSGRIALLTYGCQLRAYFSRIFPELLGPRILGVTDSSPARLFRFPTFADASDPPQEPSDGPPSVLQSLTTGDQPRWINLWRPTDYLGFPVYSRQPANPVDWPADEVTREETAGLERKTVVRVDTHGDYFRARQYPVAVECLTYRFKDDASE